VNKRKRGNLVDSQLDTNLNEALKYLAKMLVKAYLRSKKHENKI